MCIICPMVSNRSPARAGNGRKRRDGVVKIIVSVCVLSAVSTPGCLVTPMAEDVERFAARSGQRFPFLEPSRIKDAAGKRPGQPGYTARTLYIPPSWYKDQKVIWHPGTVLSPMQTRRRQAND